MIIEELDALTSAQQSDTNNTETSTSTDYVNEVINQIDFQISSNQEFHAEYAVVESIFPSSLQGLDDSKAKEADFPTSIQASLASNGFIEQDTSNLNETFKISDLSELIPSLESKISL